MSLSSRASLISFVAVLALARVAMAQPAPPPPAANPANAFQGQAQSTAPPLTYNGPGLNPAANSSQAPSFGGCTGGGSGPSYAPGYPPYPVANALSPQAVSQPVVNVNVQQPGAGAPALPPAAAPATPSPYAQNSFQDQTYAAADALAASRCMTDQESAMLYQNPYLSPYDKQRLARLQSRAARADTLRNSYMGYSQYRTGMIQEQSRTNLSRVDELQTRTKLWDAQLYERKQREKYREESLKLSKYIHLQRSITNPLLADVWSGDALNQVLQAIWKAEASGVLGPAVPLPADMAQHLDFRTDLSRGSVGLLKDNGKLQWPDVFRQEDFKDEQWKADKKAVDELARQAAQQAAKGAVSYEVAHKLDNKIQQLRQELNDKINDLSSTDWTDADAYLTDLQNSIKLLRKPQVARLFDRSWLARVHTVDQLVREMANRGLFFAPAVVGDRDYYSLLRKDLVDYYNGFNQVTMR
jgi:hypothetical protein